MEKHTAVYRREGRYWTVELHDVAGVATFGRTLAGAKVAIVEATALWFDIEKDQVQLQHTIDATA